MGQKFRDLGPVRAFIGGQHLFFVGTAPLSPGGRVNLSPKGYDTLRIVNDRLLYYVDLTGSGNETVAHVKENSRITLMWISFGESPRIVRAWGNGRVVERGDAGWEDVDPELSKLPGARAAVFVTVEMTGDSCGYSVPFFEYKGDRTLLIDRAYRRTEKDPEDYKYHSENNMWSLDALPALESNMPKTISWHLKKLGSSYRLRKAIEIAGLVGIGAAIGWIAAGRRR